MLFLGLLFERSEECTIAKKSGGVVQNQTNTFQWNCIDGLYENGVEALHIINALPVGTYPKGYSDIKIESKTWTYKCDTHYQIGSLNLPVLKQWGRYRECKKLIKKIGDKNILIYSAYQPFLKAIKKLDKSYNVTLIVPDLPEFYDYSKSSKLRKALRKLNNRSIYRCMSRVDNFVLLTEEMKNPLNVGNRSYTVVEGICASEPPSYVREEIANKKAILYAGSLNVKFGIDVLLDAFEQIENYEYELWICGGGDGASRVEEIARNDSRVKYFGFVPKEKVLELQSRASVLVNPRQNNGEYTKYSFPSKMMEYLLSGVPVVAYKLDGYPPEYDAYFNYVEDNTPHSLAQKLIEVCEDEADRCKLVANKAVEFVIKQKNPRAQARKIIKTMG